MNWNEGHFAIWRRRHFVPGFSIFLHNRNLAAGFQGQ